MVQYPPSPPLEEGDMFVDHGGMEETQIETQVATQIASQSQDNSRRSENHLWGYLIPCNSDQRRIDFSRGTHTYQIGRNTTRAVNNDFVLPGMKISNIHCFVKWDGKEDRSSVIQIEDISSNGTFINGEKIGKGRFGILKEGNEIAFGTCQPQPNGVEDYRFIYRHLAGGPPTEGLYAHYELTEELGKGSFATVMKAMSKETGQWYACKMIHAKQLKASVKGHLQDPAKALHKEVQILERLQHPNICQLKEVFYEESYINIILELVPGGDLLDYIIRNNGLQEPQAKHISYQLCDALAYIHSQGVAHRDLKPENVLLTRDVPPVVKVADFGLAKAIDSLTMLRTMCGTPSYLAPEVVTQGDNPEGYQQIVDSWSVGVIVFSMITNSTPFIEPPDCPDVKLRIINRRIDWDYLRSFRISSEALSFIRSLLQEDPKTRMSLGDALNHDWLREIREHVEPPADREATVSPHGPPQSLPDVSMAAAPSKSVINVVPSTMSVDNVESSQFSYSQPPNIPGAYPASQPLQRRRQVLDDARERGQQTPQPTAEMIRRVEEQQRVEEAAHYKTNSRPRKRKAVPEPSVERMEQDEQESSSSGTPKVAPRDTTPVGTRSRRGKAAAAADPAPAAAAAPANARRTRAQIKVDKEPAAPRRSSRNVPARARK